jgi:hypothetical protein
MVPSMTIMNLTLHVIPLDLQVNARQEFPKLRHLQVTQAHLRKLEQLKELFRPLRLGL